MNVRAEKCHRRWVNWVTEKLPAANLQTAQHTYHKMGKEVLVHTVNIVTSINQGKNIHLVLILVLVGGHIVDI